MGGRYSALVGWFALKQLSHPSRPFCHDPPYIDKQTSSWAWASNMSSGQRGHWVVKAPGRWCSVDMVWWGCALGDGGVVEVVNWRQGSSDRITAWGWGGEDEGKRVTTPGFHLTGHCSLPWSSFPRYVRWGRMEGDRGRRKKDSTEGSWWRAWSRFLKSSCRGDKAGWEKERRWSVRKGTADGEEDCVCVWEK